MMNVKKKNLFNAKSKIYVKTKRHVTGMCMHHRRELQNYDTYYVRKKQTDRKTDKNPWTRLIMLCNRRQVSRKHFFV